MYRAKRLFTVHSERLSEPFTVAEKMEHYSRNIQPEIRQRDILESRPVEIETHRNPRRIDPEKRIPYPGKHLPQHHRVINRQRPVIAAEVKINSSRRPERDLVAVPVDFQVIRIA